MYFLGHKQNRQKLMNKWMNEYRPNIDKCLNNMNGKSNNSPILSLSNLLVTFVSLMAGFIVSLLIFIGEVFIFAVRKTRGRSKIMMAAALMIPFGRYK